MHWPGLVLLAGTVAALPQPNGWEDWQSGSKAQSSSKTAASSVALPSGLPMPHWANSSASFDTNTTKTVPHVQTDAGWHDWNSIAPSKPTSSGKSWGGNDIKPSSVDEHYGHGGPGTESPGSSNRHDQWYNQPAMYDIPVPTATLAPARHWHTNPFDDKHLRPTENNNIYFSAGGTSSPRVAHQMAWLSAKFTSNAVLLDDSDRCTHTLTASSNSLVVVFKDKSAFQLAKSLWHADIVLVLNSDKCGTGANCYLKVVKLSFDEQYLTCTIGISIIDFHEAISYFDFEWGTYTLGRNPHNPGKP